MNGLTGFEPERGRENIYFRARPRGGRFGEPRGSPDGGRGRASVVEGMGKPWATNFSWRYSAIEK